MELVGGRRRAGHASHPTWRQLSRLCLRAQPALLAPPPRAATFSLCANLALAISFLSYLSHSLNSGLCVHPSRGSWGMRSTSLGHLCGCALIRQALTCLRHCHLLVGLHDCPGESAG